MPDSAVPVTNPRSRVTFQLPKTTQKLDVDMGVEGVEEDSDEGKVNIRAGFNMAVREIFKNFTWNFTYENNTTYVNCFHSICEIKIS